MIIENRLNTNQDLTLNLFPGEYAATPRTFGFGIPFSEEFNRAAVNEDLLADLASATHGRVLSIDDIPADLFKDQSDSKQSQTAIWPYLVIIFLVLLIADVAARKFIGLSSASNHITT